MAETAPNLSMEQILRQLTAPAEAGWGTDYVSRNAALLEQAARYVTEISENRPKPETEPGFYQ